MAAKYFQSFPVFCADASGLPTTAVSGAAEAISLIVTPTGNGTISGVTLDPGDGSGVVALTGPGPWTGSVTYATEGCYNPTVSVSFAETPTTTDFSFDPIIVS